jgi:UDP-N-acetylglucosamine--N-acetylmuramyl-(pentapeptide) pyrophosphoryl-undecaprenol N-acetylglucosamine transferase
MAVAAELRASGAEVSFLGARGKIEADLVPEAGYEVDLLDIRGIDRRNPLRAAIALGKAIRGVGAARRLLRGRGTDVVLGGGGYVAGTAGIAAVLSRTPLVLTEADSHLGLANRLLARRARRVCLAFPIAGRDGERYLLTGRPVPGAVLRADRAEARRRLEVDAEARCLLVMGGSQGARSINLAAVEAFAEGEQGAAREFHVVHLSGERDHEEIARRLASAPHPDRYTLIAYEDGLADVLAACDLVLARSGGSIFEVTAAGKPAILVPYPYATADHQRGNAAWMAGGGAAEVVDDADLNAADLAERVSALFGDEERLAAMSAASAALAMPDAARRIADEVLAAAEQGAHTPSGAPYVPVGSKRRTGT